MTKYEPQKQKCEDIHELLFAYMNRELGGARSDLVREHLPPFAGRHAGYDSRTVIEHSTRVESAVTSGDALNNDLCRFVNENRHRM